MKQELLNNQELKRAQTGLRRILCKDTKLPPCLYNGFRTEWEHKNILCAGILGDWQDPFCKRIFPFLTPPHYQNIPAITKRKDFYIYNLCPCRRYTNEELVEILVKVIRNYLKKQKSLEK